MAYDITGPLSYVGPGYEGDAYVPPSYMTYPIAPLGQMPPPAPLATGFSLSRIPIRQIIAAIVVVIVVALILRQLMKLANGAKKLERNAVVSRLSTKELASRLYDRMEAKGRANPATMRSLERLAR